MVVLGTPATFTSTVVACLDGIYLILHSGLERSKVRSCVNVLVAFPIPVPGSRVAALSQRVDYIVDLGLRKPPDPEVESSTVEMDTGRSSRSALGLNDPLVEVHSGLELDIGERDLDMVSKLNTNQSVLSVNKLSNNLISGCHSHPLLF